jgi:hypothetical protein
MFLVDYVPFEDEPFVFLNLVDRTVFETLIETNDMRAREPPAFVA